MCPRSARERGKDVSGRYIHDRVHIRMTELLRIRLRACSECLFTARRNFAPNGY